MAKVKEQISFKVLKLLHVYASELTSTPKAELFCGFKHRKLTSQNKIKICKLQSKFQAFR